MKTVDTLLFSIAIVWFVVVLIYLPAISISPFTICYRLEETTSVPVGFVEHCKALMTDGTFHVSSVDLVIIILITLVLLLATSFRVFLMSRKMRNVTRRAS